MSTLSKNIQDKVGFHFEPKTHSYTYDGKKMTGVTSVISCLAKPNLIPWAARMAVEFMEKAITSGEYDLTDKAVLGDLLDEAKSAHRKKKEAAGVIGTDTHALVETYINDCIENNEGKPVFMTDLNIESGDPIFKFKEWAEINVDHFLFAERQMYNKDMWVAGTADFGCVLKTGQKLIGDFKTSSGIYGIDYYLQCAGYKILAEGEGDKPYDGCVITRLGKDGSFDVTYSYDTKTAENAFMACLVLYRAQASLTQTAVNGPAK